MEKKKGINFYLKAGWLNVEILFKLMVTCVWLFVTGARNVGKTYGVLKWLLFGDKPCKKENVDFNRCFPWRAKVFPFLWLRRTPAQYKSVASNLFSKLLNREGSDLILKEKQLGNTYSGIYICERNEDGELEINEDKLICYVSSVESLGKTNGLNMDNVNLIIIDEFIKTPSENNMSREFDRVMNILESIERERVIEGKPAVRILGLSNANELANEYYNALDCIDDAVNMAESQQSYKQIADFGLVLLFNSPISKMKAETPMYRNLAHGKSKYAQMAIDNKFKKNECELVKSRNLKDCKPICSIDNVTFYSYYEDGEAWVYVSNHKMGGKMFGESRAEHMRFIATNKWLYDVFLHSYMRFENYTCMYRFHRIWDLKNWSDD